MTYLASHEDRNENKTPQETIIKYEERERTENKSSSVEETENTGKIPTVLMKTDLLVSAPSNNDRKKYLLRFLPRSTPNHEERGVVMQRVPRQAPPPTIYRRKQTSKPCRRTDGTSAQ
ncbi:hypothetical protein SK128_001359 [Halocaridina rubra]|uniref:Uncharacterized protein n=1 Tax=Halocaridina rubra TaxID=373956 RepID=A0AAN8XA23_HALRR